MEQARWAIAKGFALINLAREKYDGLTPVGKYTVWGYISLHILGALAVLIITPARLFEYMAAGAEGLRDMYLGWVLLIGMIIITSMPPLVGYGTCITLCGFAFGPWRGWMIAATGCIGGGLISFIVTRRLIHVFAPFLTRDKTFLALSRAVRVKGLPLVVLIRLCPFPFPYSNAFFASISSVSLFQFFIATLAITPKLGLHVWVGSRLYLFADPGSRTEMDTNTKLINAAYVVIGGGLGAFTSWYLYRLTMLYVAEVSLEEEEQDALEAGLLDDVDELLNEEDEAAYPPHSTAPVPHSTAPATFKSHRSRPSFTNPFSPQLVDGAQLATPRVSLESPSGRKAELALGLDGERRISEDADHWEENFSDFEEPEDDEEDEDDKEEEEKVAEEKKEKLTKPNMVHTISMEKRMD